MRALPVLLFCWHSLISVRMRAVPLRPCFDGYEVSPAHITLQALVASLSLLLSHLVAGHHLLAGLISRLA